MAESGHFAFDLYVSWVAKADGYGSLLIFSSCLRGLSILSSLIPLFDLGTEAIESEMNIGFDI